MKQVCECTVDQIKEKGIKSENGNLFCLNCGKSYDQPTLSAEIHLDDLTVFQNAEIAKLRKSIKSHRNGALLLWVLIVINTIGGFAWSQVYKSPNYSTGSIGVANAMSSYNMNNMTATTVYQQQVVNGWVAKDLLETIAKQNGTIIEMESEKSGISAFLLFNILFTLGIIGVIIVRIGFMLTDQSRLNYLESVA